MATPVNIIGSRNSNRAKVTKFGQLVTAPLQYSTPVSVELDVINTAFNLLTPASGQSVVITDIIVSADRNVSTTTPANIVIYQALEADLLLPDKTIVRPQLVRSGNASYIGLNMIVDEGKWVNARTDDVGVLVTIMFYLVPQDLV